MKTAIFTAVIAGAISGTIASAVLIKEFGNEKPEYIFNCADIGGVNENAQCPSNHVMMGCKSDNPKATSSFEYGYCNSSDQNSTVTIKCCGLLEK